jgi:hypothetical protein
MPRFGTIIRQIGIRRLVPLLVFAVAAVVLAIRAYHEEIDLYRKAIWQVIAGERGTPVAPAEAPRPPSSAEERLAVLRCLSELHRQRAVSQMVPTLEQWMKDDPDADVRQKAVEVRGLIAVEHEDKVCPLSVAQALFDKEENVHQSASLVACLFKKYPPPVMATLLKAATHTDAEVRNHAIGILAEPAKRDKAARAAIGTARNDPDFHVRHNAHCGWYALTGDLESFVPHCLRTQAEYSNMPPLPPESSERAQMQHCTKRFIQTSTLEALQRRGEEHPDEVAKSILRHLQSSKQVLRRGAAALVGSLAADAQAVRRQARRPDGKLAPGLGEQRTPKRPNGTEALDSPKLLARLSEMNVEAILRTLARTDAEEAVRKSAAAALEKWSALQKPRP